MRKLSTIIIILLTVIACKKGDKNFTLTGEIAGLGNDTLYIYEQTGSENDLDTIIVKGGAFEYALKIDTITPLILLACNTVEYPIYADKNLKVSVEGKASALSELQIRGGNINNELNEFRNSTTPFERSSKETVAKAEGFIRRHPHSPASIYILDKYFVQNENPDYGQINTMLKILGTNLQDDIYIKQLSDKIDKQVSVAVGKFAPAFDNKDKDGKSITFSDFKDKYLLITFWASWWTPYPKEYETLKSIRNKFKKEKFALLGISLDIDRKSWLEAMKKDTLKGIQATDLGGWNNSIVKQYGIEKLPSNILIGPDRKILAKNLDKESLIQKLEELFK